METFLYALKLGGILLGMTSIIPAMVWAASGSLRKAMHAWSGYLAVMGVFVVVGGGLGLLAAFMEWLNR